MNSTQFPPAAPTYPLSFDTIAASLSSPKKSKSLESVKYSLFSQNTRGMVSRTAAKLHPPVQLEFLVATSHAPAFAYLGALCASVENPSSSLLCFHNVTNRSSQPSICKSLSFHQVTNPFFRNSRIFTSLQIAGGCRGPALQQPRATSLRKSFKSFASCGKEECYPLVYRAPSPSHHILCGRGS
jgi:hypothetical protein